jgi:hypothetical protein
MSETPLAKIAITQAADSALSQALEEVNEGFEGGRITKTELASWLISRAAGAIDHGAREEIRHAHFNQVAYLESLVRKLKSTGRGSLDPSEVATLQAVLEPSEKKRVKPRKEDRDKTKTPALSSDEVTPAKAGF